MTHGPFCAGLLSIVLGAALGACSSTPLGAQPANLAKANATPGAAVFKRSCASCHGEAGEGVSNTPPVMGSTALPLYKRDPATISDPAMQDPAEQLRQKSLPPGADARGAFKTAADLFKYVSREMPQPKAKAGSLSPEEYWAVINYMLVGHGSAVPEGGVNAGNAASVAIKPPN
jgi:mono/diheme cytochrome c family protein